jgi:hypothetical protein
LFQEIKDVPIYVKFVHELFLRKLGREKKDALTTHVIGKLVDLIMGNILMTKYVDIGISVVNVHINNTSIPNNLFDMGKYVNVMTKKTMEKIQLPCLRPTPNILQLV